MAVLRDDLSVQSDMLDREQLLHKQALLQLITASTPSPSIKGNSSVTSPLPSPTPSMSSLHYFSAVASLKTTPALVTPDHSRTMLRAHSADSVTPDSNSPLSPPRLPLQSVTHSSPSPRSQRDSSDRKNELSDVKGESTVSSFSAVDAYPLPLPTPPHVPSPISTSVHSAVYGIVRPPPFIFSPNPNTSSIASSSSAASLGSPRKSPIRTPLGSPRPPDRPPSVTSASRTPTVNMDITRPEEFGSTILESKILTLSDENRTLNRVCASQRAELDALADRIELQKKEKAAMEASHNAAMSDLLDMKLEGMTSVSTPSRDKGGDTAEPRDMLALAALTAQLAERDAEVDELRRIIQDRGLFDDGGEGEEGDDGLDFHIGSQVETGARASGDTDERLSGVWLEDIKGKEKVETGSSKAMAMETNSNPISDCSSANFSPHTYDLADSHIDLTPDLPIDEGGSVRTPSSIPPEPHAITTAVAELYEGRDRLSSLPRTPQRSGLYRSTTDGNTFYDMDNSRDEESNQDGDSMLSNNDDCISPPKMSRSLSLSLAQGRPFIRSYPGMVSRSLEIDDDQEMRVRTFQQMTVIFNFMFILCLFYDLILTMTSVVFPLGRLIHTVLVVWCCTFDFLSFIIFLSKSGRLFFTLLIRLFHPSPFPPMSPYYPSFCFTPFHFSQSILFSLQKQNVAVELRNLHIEVSVLSKKLATAQKNSGSGQVKRTQTPLPTPPTASHHL